MKPGIKGSIEVQPSSIGITGIRIHGDIGDGEATSDGLSNKLRGVTGGTIYVFINSCGGMAHEGIAMYNILKAHDARVVTVIEGLAASAASIIAMAGDEVMIYPSALMMIHESWSEDEDADQALSRFDRSMRGIYAAKTGKSPEEIAYLMSNETWMNAEEAVTMGFADEVINFDEIAPEMKDSRVYALAASYDINPPKVPGRAEPKPANLQQLAEREGVGAYFNKVIASTNFRDYASGEKIIRRMSGVKVVCDAFGKDPSGYMDQNPDDLLDQFRAERKDKASIDPVKIYAQCNARNRQALYGGRQDDVPAARNEKRVIDTEEIYNALNRKHRR